MTALAGRTFRVFAAVDDVYGYRCLLTVDAGTVTLEIGRLSWYLPRMGETIRHEDRPVHLVRNPFATPWLRFVLMLYDDQHRAAVKMGRRTADAVLDALRPDVEVELSTARFTSWGAADLPLLQYRWITRGKRRHRDQWVRPARSGSGPDGWLAAGWGVAEDHLDDGRVTGVTGPSTAPARPPRHARTGETARYLGWRCQRAELFPRSRRCSSWPPPSWSPAPSSRA